MEENARKGQIGKKSGGKRKKKTPPGTTQRGKKCPATKGPRMGGRPGKCPEGPRPCEQRGKQYKPAFELHQRGKEKTGNKIPENKGGQEKGGGGMNHDLVRKKNIPNKHLQKKVWSKTQANAHGWVPFKKLKGKRPDEGKASEQKK